MRFLPPHLRVDVSSTGSSASTAPVPAPAATGRRARAAVSHVQPALALAALAFLAGARQAGAQGAPTLVTPDGPILSWEPFNITYTVYPVAEDFDENGQWYVTRSWSSGHSIETINKNGTTQTIRVTLNPRARNRGVRSTWPLPFVFEVWLTGHEDAKARWETTIDPDPPQVYLSGPSTPQNGPFDVAVHVSEENVGFAQSQFVVGNGSLTAFSGGPRDHTATITPAASGTVTVDFPADVLTDGVGHKNPAASRYSVEADLEAPVLTVSGVPDDIETTDPFSVTFDFSETVSDFTAADVTVVNGSLGALTGGGSNWSADVTPDGSGDVTVTVAADAARDAAGNTAPPAPVSMTAVAPAHWGNAAPVIADPGTKTYVQGESITPFDIDVSDADGDAVTVSVAGLPNGLAYDSATGVSGTVAADAAVQDYTVTVTADDGVNAAVTASFTIAVKSLLRSIAVPADRTYTQGETIAPFDIEVTGSDLTDVTVGGLPPGLAYDDAAKAVSGTVAAAAAIQDYTVTVTATFTGLALSETFTITVTRNAPPVISDPGPKTYTQGETITPFAIEVTDADGDDVTVRVDGLPPGLAYDADAGQVSGTVATDAAVQEYPATATAIDARGASSTASFDVTVTEGRAAKETTDDDSTGDDSTGDDSTDDDSTGDDSTDDDSTSDDSTSDDSTNDDSTNDDSTGDDSTGDDSTNDDSTGDHSTGGDSTNDDSTGDDSTGDDSGEPNTAPAVTVPGSKTYARGETIPAFAIEVTDADGDDVTVTVAGLPAGLGYGAGVVSGTVAADAEVGSYRVTVTADDGRATAAVTFAVTVTVGNRAPVLGPIAAQRLAVGETRVVDVTRLASDPDGDRLSYAAEAADAEVVEVRMGSPVEVRGLRAGRTTVTVRVTDPGGLGAQRTFRVTVVNRAPRFAEESYGFELVEHADGRTTPVAVGTVVAVDEDPGDRVRYALTPAAARFSIDEAAGALGYVGPGEDYEAGPVEHALTVRATDRWGGAATVAVTVRVVNADDPGVVTLSGSGAEVGTALEATLSDPDGEVSAARWRWERRMGGGWEAIGSADGAVYTPEAADVGWRLRAAVSYRDGHGPGKEAVSEATEAVQVGVEQRSAALEAVLGAFGRTVASSAVDALEARFAAAGRSGPTWQAALDGRRLTAGAFGSGGEASAVFESLTEHLPRRSGRDALGPAGMSGSAAGMSGSAAGTSGRPAGAAAGPAGADVLGSALGTRTWVGRGGVASTGLAHVRSATLEERLSRSAFAVALTGSEASDTASDAASGRGWTAWGRGDLTYLAGRPERAPAGEVALDGRVASGLAGVDYRWGGGVLLGVAVSRHAGLLDYESAGTGAGAVEAGVTSVQPYARWSPRPGLGVWGLAGGGWGTATLADLEAEGRETDLGLRLAAAGVRQELAATRGVSWAAKADAFAVGLSAAAADGLLAVDAGAQRVRALLEGRTEWALTEGSRLTPRFEVGARVDRGEADRGAGLEVGGGLTYAHARSGLRLEGRARRLLAHRAAGFDEWGASVTLRVDPGRQEQGLSLALAPVWGEAASGVAALWSTPHGLARRRGGDPRTAHEGAGTWRPDALQQEVGYALPLGPHALLTPYATLRQYDVARQLRLGGRLALGSGDPGAGDERAFHLELFDERLTRPGAPPAHRVAVAGVLRYD